MLTRDEILNAPDIQVEKVEVPEWGGEIFVKGMTGSERDSFEAGLITNPGKDSKVNFSNLRAKLCALTICDENGKRLFSESDVRDLSKKSATALQRVFTVAQKLSGLTQADIEELTEELQDNPLGDSTSG